MKELFIIAFLLIGSLVDAQNLAYKQPNDTNVENLPTIPDPVFVFENDGSNNMDMSIDENINSHYLGYETAKRMYIFKKTYVYEDGLRINIEKPVIYKSINKINKHLKQQVKKGNITKGVAEKELTTFLDIAVIIVSQPTGLFENALKNAKTSNDLIQLFKSVKIKNI